MFFHKQTKEVEQVEKFVRSLSITVPVQYEDEIYKLYPLVWIPELLWIWMKEELDNSVVAKFATTALDGKIYQIEHYNLDMIISVGYRVKSNRGVEFRKWANKVLKQYII